jgi:hypothetical protein
LCPFYREGEHLAVELIPKRKEPSHLWQRFFFAPYFVVSIPYAISGMRLTTCSCGVFFFSHTLALQRPTNGAAAIIPKAVPKAICINISFFPKALNILLG